MSSYANHGKTTSANRNSGGKSTFTERDRCKLRRTVSKNHRTAAAQVTGQQSWIFIIKICSHKNFPTWAFTNPTSIVRLQLLNLWLLKVMLRCVNDGVTPIKPGHQTTGNGRVIWSDESSFTLFPTSGRVYVWRTPKETYNPECLLPILKHGEGSVIVWAAISWYSILLVPLLPFMAELL
jgi:hypothetical protein